MKIQTTKSSTGGTITPVFNKEGLQTGLIHNAGNAYSGKTAEQESKKNKSK